MSNPLFLVDDPTVVREGLRALLEAQPDLKVVGGATTGREAVGQVSRLRPDIVLMDINMPDLNGIEATQQIRQVCPTTQVIILSMHATAEYIQRALQAGAQGYVLKESVGSEVIEAVRTVHAGQRYLNPKVSNRLINDIISAREPGQVSNPLTSLSPREREILQLVVEGNSSIDIATALSLSPNTVDTYRSRLMRKLGMSDVPSLVKFAIRHGLTSLE
jgi:DNA-binding NarL/FixJ family response regulator